MPGPKPTPKKPTKKVQASGLAGAVSVLVVWIVSQLGVEVPPEVASAFTTIVGFGAGYLR